MDAASPQPSPIGVGVEILPLVIADLQMRGAAGLAKYGVALRTDNGRNALVDAYQESLDKSLYLRQAIEENSSKAALQIELRQWASQLVPASETLPYRDPMQYVGEYVEKLEQRCSELRHQVVVSDGASELLEGDVAELNAKLDKVETEARKDSERLDWILNYAYIEHHTPGVYSSIVRPKTREAIDEAMKEVRG